MAEVEVVPEELELDEFEQELASKGALVLRESASLTTIENDDTYHMVCARALTAKANIDALTNHVKEAKDSAYKHWKKITNKLATLIAPFEEVTKRDALLIAKYQEAQKLEQKRREVQARIDAERATSEGRAKEAQMLFDAGREAEALRMLDTVPILTAPVAVAKAAPKVSGISNAKIKYVAVVEDFEALVNGVASGKVPISMLEANQKNLDKIADALKELLLYPGVRVEKQSSVSLTAGRR
jgi:hypothetical protein